MDEEDEKQKLIDQYKTNLWCVHPHARAGVNDEYHYKTTSTLFLADYIKCNPQVCCTLVFLQSE